MGTKLGLHFDAKLLSVRVNENQMELLRSSSPLGKVFGILVAQLWTSA